MRAGDDERVLRREAAFDQNAVALLLADGDGALRPGAYVKLLMSARYDQPKLAIPLAALVFEGEKRFVYVVKDGKTEKRLVSVGEQQGDRILVESGLAADESFVTAGTHKLRDGAAVKEQ